MSPAHQHRVAAIDCGTNSIRLLVADIGLTEQGVQMVDVLREMRIVRLGEGVDATGLLTGGALDRTWRALADYAALIRASGATRVRMAATSATRDARNRDDFVAMVLSTLGQEPEVISGAEEAELSFRGAVGDLDPATGSFLVADIGGGSTELVVGRVSDGAPDLAGAVSLDIGSVRITERLLTSDPPTAAELRRATALVRSELVEGLSLLDLRQVARLIAVSGTATTVAAGVLARRGEDAEKPHLATVTTAEVQQLTGLLLGATRAHRAGLPWVHPGRVDVIGGGALILRCLADLVGERTGITTVTVSEHDILDGLALSLM